MQTYNSITKNSLMGNRPTRLHELVYSQLIELDTREIMLVYEMIQLIRQPKEPKNHIENPQKLSFIDVQQALINLQGNLSSDIISEREDRL